MRAKKRKRQCSLKSFTQHDVPEFNAGKRCGLPSASVTSTEPAEVDNSITEEEKAVPVNRRRAVDLDLLWVLLRCGDSHIPMFGSTDDVDLSVPSWSAFNALACPSSPAVTEVGYLPVIPSSPTELSTVYELLKRSCAIAAEMHQHHDVITVDQAIYAKALEVVW